jgi:hypothetical protein
MSVAKVGSWRLVSETNTVRRYGGTGKVGEEWDERLLSGTGASAGVSACAAEATTQSGWLRRRAARSRRIEVALRMNNVRHSRPLRAPHECDRDVAGPAQQPVVLQAAFAAAVRNRNDVVGFPTRTRRPPGPARRAIADGRFRAGPFTMRLDDVEAAEPARALISLLHLPTHVPRAAADLPFVDAPVSAEGPPRGLDRRVAPPADRKPRFVPLGLPPLLGSNDALTTGTHSSRIGTSTAKVYAAPGFHAPAKVRSA